MPFVGKDGFYPSDYLHYWWEDYSGSAAFLSSKYFATKQSILAQQLRNAKRRRSRTINRLSKQTGLSKQTFSEIYDTLDRNPNALSGDTPINDSSAKSEPQSIEAALGIVNSTDSWLNSVNKDANSLFRAAEKMVSPNLVKIWAETVLDDYVINSINAGSFSGGITDENRSRAASEIISNFRNRQTNGKLFSVPKNLEDKEARNASALSIAEREILALIASIGIMQTSSSVQSSVKSSWGGVISQWKNQCQGLANVVAGKTHELASAMGLLSAVQKMDKLDEQIAKTLTPETIEGKNISIKRMFTKNSTFDNLKMRANASAKRVSKKIYKSDVALTMNTNGVDIEFIRATAKNKISYYPNDPLIEKSGFLTIHNHGSFTNFLNRELGMGKKELQGVVQLVVAHSDTINLDTYWDQLKENVAYNGFLSALAGFSAEEQAEYMIIGEKIFPIQNIIESAMNQDITPYAVYSPNYDRNSFMSKNPWLGTAKKNRTAAIERSEVAWNNTAQMLNSMILTIKMDITKNFIANHL
jgi:hypothetical protein